MEYLDCSNTKQTQYYNILKQLNIDNTEKVFNKKGKLIICLIELCMEIKIKFILKKNLNIGKI